MPAARNISHEPVSQWNFQSISLLPQPREGIVSPQGRQGSIGPDGPALKGDNHMKRRSFLASAGAAAGLTLMPKLAFAAANRIDWYTSSDQNIIDFWTNIVKPKFEAANSGVAIYLV